MKRVMGWEQFKERLTWGVSTKYITEGEPLDEDYDFLHGFKEGEIAYTEDGVVSYPEFIDQEGGGEGGAEDCYTVVKIGDKHYKITYSYYSHQGYDTDYADVYEVTPRETMITVYE